MTGTDFGADALAEAYARYAGELLGAATSILGDRSAAEGVVRDTLLEAAPRIGEVGVHPQGLRPWLLGLLVRRARALPQGPAHTGPGPADDHDVGSQSAGLSEPDSGMSRRDVADLLRHAVSALTGSDRDVVDLRLYAGLEAAEVAGLLHLGSRDATLLLRRVENRLEQAVGALLVARHGRRDCDRLDALLADWDGRYTVDVRSRVIRHAAACSACRRRWTSSIGVAHLSAAVWSITPGPGVWAAVESALLGPEPPAPPARPAEPDRHPEPVPLPRRVRRAVVVAGATVTSAGIVAAALVTGLAVGPDRNGTTVPSALIEAGADDTAVRALDVAAPVTADARPTTAGPSAGPGGRVPPGATAGATVGVDAVVRAVVRIGAAPPDRRSPSLSTGGATGAMPITVAPLAPGPSVAGPSVAGPSVTGPQPVSGPTPPPMATTDDPPATASPPDGGHPSTSAGSGPVLVPAPVAPVAPVAGTPTWASTSTTSSTDTSTSASVPASVPAPAPTPTTPRRPTATAPHPAGPPAPHGPPMTPPRPNPPPGPPSAPPAVPRPAQPPGGPPR